MFNYWDFYPPLRDIVAGFVGFKPKEEEEKSKPMTRDQFVALVQRTGGKSLG
jgi:hypothetical protein